MPWITLPGVTGKIYAPDHDGINPKKHPCPTCFACQWCDETRCRVCRCEREGRREAAGWVNGGCHGGGRPRATDD